MEKVTSKDGTPIAYDKLGSGPAVILVSGGSADHTANAPLAEHLTMSQSWETTQCPSSVSHPVQCRRSS